jgi:hypothetical protein
LETTVRSYIATPWKSTNDGTPLLAERRTNQERVDANQAETDDNLKEIKEDNPTKPKRTAI